ncbi:condensation domain-containing protein [Symbioplanes lichenis]|uniref:condensation domain-containing protein n=1 Tax=Symbioplanes lichenis TaxID=1629072 RepID=UPI00273870A3|nr:condensation domain-containing protein [Actinoplanes lichenis]
MPDRDIAVVGIAVRFPQAGDLSEFRGNLRAGRDSVRDIPEDRVASTGLDPSTAYEPMGYLDRIDLFDHRFFGLSRREAELMDPHHRLALQLSLGAIEDAGLRPSGLRDSRTAVVLSAPGTDFAGLAGEAGTLAMLGTWPSAQTARVARHFGLVGPCYNVDTGCNGSLIAVHHACRELWTGDADLALAGGVSLRVRPDPAAAAGDFPALLSARGRCRAFDAAADGTVSGEGGAVLLLATRARAEAEGLPCHAVIRGSAVAHNGRRSADLATPSAAAQAAVITRAWQVAGADLATAGYLEAHGSGTRLGDAVEVEGLALAGRQAGRRAGALPIGSVKTAIGHLDHAAGIAGLVKAILSVRHAERYPTLHFTAPPDGVDLTAAGVRVVTTAETWEARDGTPRRAGVSSFSLGGTVAHCVVEQAPPRAETTGLSGSRLVVVSARTHDELLTACRRTALALRPGVVPLADVAATLGAGRDHHPHRVAVVAADTAAAATALAAEVTWRRSTGAGEPGPAPRLLVLLSGDAEVPSGGTDELPAALPLRDRYAAVVAWQLMAFRWLVAAGVPIHGILSSGAGRYAARWLRGELSAADTARLGGTETFPAADRDRLRTVAAQLADGPVRFVELGHRGEIGEALRAGDILAAPVAVDVVQRHPDGLLRLLGRLYEAGIDVDWAALDPPGHPARRVHLPGYPLRGERCWPRPAGVAPRPAPGPTPPAAVAPDPGAGVLPWLSDTLRALLHADEVPADADYFELGGNSVVALQLVDRVREAYRADLRVLDVHDHPLVSDLAGVIADRAAGPAAAPPAPAPARSALPPITPGGERVLSFGQERMWFHHELDPETTLYNLPVSQRRRGPLDPAVLRAAWEDLAARHEVLRSNFVSDDGRPRLVIRPALGDFLSVADVSGEPDPRAAARAVLRAEERRPFDLATDPLVRVVLIRLAADEHIDLTTMHHAVNDGWAPTVLDQELESHLAARAEGRRHELPPLPIQYHDYARWQRDLLRDGLLDPELEYWKDALREVPVLRLPTDRRRPDRRDYAGDVHPFVISGELVDSLRSLGREESATLFAVVLAGLFVLLHQDSGQDDIVVGTPTIGRTHPELWQLIGFFNNTVALRGDLSDRPSFRELVRRTRRTVLAGLDHQEVPFDKVVKAVAQPREPGRSPLFDVMYVHQTLPPEAAHAGDPVTGPDEPFPGIPAGTAKFDLSLVIGEHAGRAGLTAGLEYSTQLFDRPTVAATAERFLAVLHRVVERPDLPLDRLGPAPAAAAGADPATTAGDLAYWRSETAGAPLIDLPGDRLRPLDGDDAVAVHRHTVPARIVRATGVDAGIALLAAFLTVVSARTGVEDLLVGLPLTAPGDPERVVPAAIRADLGDEPSWTTLTSRVAAAVARARGHLSVSLADLAGRGDLPPVPGRHPLTDLWFAAGPGDETAGAPGRTPHDLAVTVDGDGDADVVVRLTYRTALYDPATVEGVAQELTTVLRRAGDEPGTAVFDLWRPAEAGPIGKAIT